jgi:hypothetical protein
MSVTLLPSAGPDGLLEDYVDHQRLLGGAPSWRRERVAAAREFLGDHPDLDVWMAEGLDARLVELQRRRPGTWPFVGFAILTGACRADADLLLRAGSSLAEVGQVLRHRSALATSIYAKVDERSLAALVRPWPGGVR